jgi:hypothetical protein
MRKVAVIFSGTAYNYQTSIGSLLENLLIPNDADAFILTSRHNELRRTPHSDEVVTDSMPDAWVKKVQDQVRITEPIDADGVRLIRDTFGDRLKGLCFLEDLPDHQADIDAKRAAMMNAINSYIEESKQRGHTRLPFGGNTTTDPSNGCIRCVVDQYNHAKRCFQIMEAHERAVGERYAWVVRVRLDFVCPEPFVLERYYLNQDVPYLYVSRNTMELENPVEWLDEFFWFSPRDIAQSLFTGLSRMGLITDRNYRTIHQEQQSNDFMFAPETQFALLVQELGLPLLSVRVVRGSQYTDGGDGFDYLNYVLRRSKINTYGLKHEYSLVCRGPSDINEHLPVLREYAERCSHVTELGTRFGNSTVAFMAARPDVFISYDPAHNERVEYLKLMAEEAEVNFKFRQEGPEEIEETDLLFIDTNHHAEQCERELRLFAHRVKRYLVFHDTATFWEKGQGHESGGGLRYAIEPFMSAHPEWVQVYRSEDNNGLLILERIGDHEPPE